MIFWLLLRTLRHRLVPNLLTVLAVALGVGVALAVPLTLSALREGTLRASQVFDLIVAAKGSPTQVALNTIFLSEPPVGNIPYRLYTDLTQDKRTRRAIPLGYGDNFDGFPLVGTKPVFFEQRETLSSPAFYRLETGRLFSKPGEAVLGSQAARTTGLKVGGRFESGHGFAPTLDEERHQTGYTVVGVLAPTGGPGDRGVYVDIQSLWTDHGQVASGPRGDTREVTAVLYTTTKLGYIYQVSAELARGKEAQGVFPGQVVGGLLDLLGQGRAGYAIVGSLVLLLALATVAVNTYASALAGQRNLAILRAIGARAGTVLAVVLLEALSLAALGVLLGVGLAYGGTLIAGRVLESQVGLTLPVLALEPADALRALALLPVAVLFALAPALAAARRSPLERLR